MHVAAGVGELGTIVTADSAGADDGDAVVGEDVG
jgi:hypothetical protein